MVNQAMATSRPRALSPRQLAIKKREQTIEKVLNELGAGPASWIKKIELEDKEKLVTIRAAVARATFEHLVGFQMSADMLRYNATR